jgi:hypothetical protein
MHHSHKGTPMNINDDNTFLAVLSTMELTMDDFENFKEHFGGSCENSMPENTDLRKVFILQSKVHETVNLLKMDACDVAEGLTELCIAQYTGAFSQN